jgi:hypothetical protein
LGSRGSLVVLGLIVSFCFSTSSGFSREYGKEEKNKVVQVKMDKEQFSMAEKVLANNESKLMNIPGVVGVGIGLTEKTAAISMPLSTTRTCDIRRKSSTCV